MAEIVCRRCGQTREQMGQLSITGKIAELVRNNVCYECWAAWHEQQVMIVNEFRLQLFDPEDRQKLRIAMMDFLNLPES
jgi:Fe-S cluster biosynthesis and repair protein YggX